MDIHKYRKIWKDIRNDPSLKNTLDVNALLAKERDRHIGIEHTPQKVTETKQTLVYGTKLPPLPLDRQADLIAMNNENLAVLRELSPPLAKPFLYDLHKKLTGFFHIEELHELRLGRYTRWIRDDDHETLKSGGILVDVKFSGKGTLLSILPIRAKHPFNLRFDSAEIFQKLTDEEKIMAAAAAAVSTPVQAWSELPAIR